MNFSPMVVGEVLPKGFDLSRNLAAGETVTAAAFSVSVVRGTNPDPNAMKSGIAEFSGSKAWQKIAALVPGYYELRGQVTTSLGRVYIERGVIEVVA